MPKQITATIGSCESPIYKNNEYCKLNSPIIEPSIADVISEGIPSFFGLTSIAEAANATSIAGSANFSVDIRGPEVGTWWEVDVASLRFESPAGTPLLGTAMGLVTKDTPKTETFGGVGAGFEVAPSLGILISINPLGGLAGSGNIVYAEAARRFVIPGGFNLRGILSGAVAFNPNDIARLQCMYRQFRHSIGGLISNEFTSKQSADIPQAVKSNRNGKRKSLIEICSLCGR